MVSIIKEKACSIAASLGNSKFKASNGFLWKWLKRHNISLRTISGEALSAKFEEAELWKRNKLMEILNEYR